jgi:hypothetical protein
MKLQILDEGLDSKREGEKTISFFNELDIETRTMLEDLLFHFLTRLPQRRKNYPRKLSS